MSKQKNLPQTADDPIGWPLIQSFQSELNRMFDRFNANPFGIEHKLMPALDVAETDNAVEITAEIPGVKSEDLDVSIVDDTLILKGRKSDEREESGKDWHHVERSFGSFRRRVPLGFSPKDGEVDASFKDGVLTLKIAKPAEAKQVARKIEIAGK
ncbi:Hsp20/alpha crystallin family protein [Maribius pontilimi]|uniref:Hsp20/alpha crystallin family protein n=1 Tax=Palleronia pontilimi TaxID=1964209 RepID=A0A934MHW8_9RHOB|nr:Hsp20/alpha crystallin family protein [Palleronia pontilimi]MBJ3763699.1 Hsp20/alpha crystallin family protein [Palleronia pontilimi]